MADASDAPPDDEKHVYSLEFEVQGEKLGLQARVPVQPVRVADLLPIFHGLEQVNLDAATAHVEEDGKTVSCRRGCGACCRQIVPISPSEARYLAELVDAMPRERRDQVRARFREALDVFERNGVGEALRRIGSSEDPDEKLAFGHTYLDQRVACPFLEDESCSIHLHRPLACREYLVTSAPEHCAEPSSEAVDRVPIPTHLSAILFRFEDGEGKDEARWLPLVLALEWAAAQGDVARTFPGTRLFENFVARYAEAASGGDA